MTRSSRLMATMLAALFAAVLAAPAYATGSTCVVRLAHVRLRLQGGGHEVPRPRTPNGKRDSGEPGLAGWRIWADYDDDGIARLGRAVRRHGRRRPLRDRRASSRRAAPHDRHLRRTARSTACASSAPGGGTDGWTCSYPERLDLRRLRQRHGRRLRLRPRPDRRQPRTPNVTGKDFGNYKKPKVTVIKDLVPATDSGPLRAQGRQDGRVARATAARAPRSSTRARTRSPRPARVGPSSPTTTARSPA